jgi:2-oxoglutarate ferredoxin oxidoreductase subunit gamma
MLGFVTAVTQIVTRDEMREAVKSSVPAGTEELNLQAFDAGVKHFDETYGQDKPSAGADQLSATGSAAEG